MNKECTIRCRVHHCVLQSGSSFAHTLQHLCGMQCSDARRLSDLGASACVLEQYCKRGNRVRGSATPALHSSLKGDHVLEGLPTYYSSDLVAPNGWGEGRHQPVHEVAFPSMRVSKLCHEFHGACNVPSVSGENYSTVAQLCWGAWHCCDVLQSSCSA